MRRIRRFLFIALAGGLCASCSKESDLASAPETPPDGPIVSEYATASMTIAWPMGPAENPNNWSGDESDRSGGAMANTGCGYRNTHSGAEVQARDLNRNDGNDNGKPVYAGFTGKVVRARYDGGYGNTVVVYDASRHVALRYAHLSSMAVREGQYISIRQHIGYLGSTGNVTGPHLHIVGYENINDNNGNPIIPTLCDDVFYACTIYFMC